MNAALLAALLVAGAPISAGAAPAPQPVTIHIRNYHFVPPRLTVPAGTVVRFVNDDEEPHTATAFDKSFDSKGLDTHESYVHTFAEPGTTEFYCTLHPMMRGKIVVTK
jgi:plastocyanin